MPPVLLGLFNLPKYVRLRYLSLGHIFSGGRNGSLLTESEQVSNGLILHCDVQISGGDGDVGVAGGVADFGQGSSSGQSVADERVSAVVDR